jgi:hypothetical protein
MSEAGEFAMMLAMGTVGVAFIVVVLRPLVNALAHRLSGRQAWPSQDIEERLARLEDIGLGTDQVALSSQRLAELEERLDFAERILAQKNDPLALGSVRAKGDGT